MGLKVSRLSPTTCQIFSAGSYAGDYLRLLAIRLQSQYTSVPSYFSDTRIARVVTASISNGLRALMQ